MPASALRGVLSAARAAAAHSTDLGDRFERLCAAALVAHNGPNGADRFKHVWLWDEWPGSDGPDTGIDLVAQQSDRTSGGLAAIQCKFYKGQVSTQDIDSFLAASGRPEFTHRIVMHTGPGIQKHGAAKIRNARPPCEIFDLREMSRWKVDWWGLAESHHVVAPGTPHTKVRAKGVHGIREAFRRVSVRYCSRWRERWAAAKSGARIWLVAEALLMLTLAAAFVLAVLAVLAVIGLVLAAVFLLSSDKKSRRR